MAVPTEIWQKAIPSVSETDRPQIDSCLHGKIVRMNTMIYPGNRLD
jgi:hypothetical protein